MRVPKYYTYNKKSKLYQVKKRINGEWNYFGYYKTQKQAEKIVEHLKNVNWDISKLPENIQVKINKTMKYYYYDKKYRNWRVIKNKVYFGSYNSKKEAENIVLLLQKHNWDLSKLSSKELGKLNLPVKRNNPKHYTYDKIYGKYKIRKTVNGILRHYGSYDTEKEAKEAVELLKKNNWNKECLSL